MIGAILGICTPGGFQALEGSPATAPAARRNWLTCKNPACEAVRREAEEDWVR